MKNLNTTAQIIERLKSTLLKKRLVWFAGGLLLTMAVVIGFVVLLSLLARLFVLPLILKNSLLIIFAAAALFVFIRFALKKMMAGTVESVAVELEQKHKDLKGLLIAAIQFSKSENTAGYSNDLIIATQQKATEQANLFNFSEAVSFYPLFKTGRYLIFSTAIALLMLVLIPGLFSYSYEVYSNPTEIVAPPIAYQLFASPTNTEVVKYRDVNIGGSIIGTRLPDQATIFYKLTGGNWQQTEIELNTQRLLTATDGTDSLSFQFKLRQVERSFDFYVTAGRLKSDVQKIDVVDRPRVNGIKLSLFYPDYTNLEPEIIDENNGSFSAVTGSRVNLLVTSNLPVETAELVMADSSRLPLKVDGKSASGSLVVETSQPYYIRLRDHLGEENPDPIEYFITAVPDEYPSIDILYPGYDIVLNDDMMIPFKIRMYDDYGFSSLVLKYQAVNQGRPSEEHVAIINYSDNIKTEGEVELNWDLIPLHIYPGDYVVYYFELADNDRISGPKITTTRKFAARVPSLDEIISDLDNNNQKRVTNTEEILEAGKELSQRLEKAARKMHSEMNQLNNKLTWQNQKELKAIADQNMSMAQKIEQIAEEMNKSIDELGEKSLMGQQLLDKMAEIQKLFEEIATPEMKAAREKLLEAMKNMDQDQLEKAVEDFELSQKDMLERLERTLALLKKMQLEQKMEAMVRKVEELVKEQQAQNEKTESSNKNDLSSLSQKENQLKQELENLKEELDELDELAKEAKLPETPEFEKFKEALDKNDANKDMSEMAQSLEEQKQEQASSQGKKALEKLNDLLNIMQQQQLAMSGSENKEMENQIRNAIKDANNLSQDQEELLKQAAMMRTQTNVFNDIAAQQQELLKACSGLGQRINELSGKSPFLATELSQMFKQAQLKMQTSTADLQDRRATQSINNQREAMAGLNKISVRLKESLDNQKDCNKGGSCSKPSSDMQSMAEKQNQLNQKTQGQCDKPGGSEAKEGTDGEGQRQSLQRLATEQGALRKSMEQMASEYGQSRQILGRLDDIAKEMKKVEEALEAGETGAEVTDRQLSIFSRMLEASRSLYRKDFTDQRQAKSAGEQLIYLPPQLSNDLFNNDKNLENRLKDYLKGNYPPQYEEQIKAYFKALMKIQTNQTDLKSKATE